MFTLSQHKKNIEIAGTPATQIMYSNSNIKIEWKGEISELIKKYNTKETL